MVCPLRGNVALGPVSHTVSLKMPVDRIHTAQETKFLLNYGWFTNVGLLAKNWQLCDGWSGLDLGPTLRFPYLGVNAHLELTHF